MGTKCGRSARLGGNQKRRGMTEAALDALELELRLLSGVVGVGAERSADALTIHLYVDPRANSIQETSELRRRASEIGRSHIEGPVFIEIEGANATAGRGAFSSDSPRVNLLAIREDEIEDEVEVHLSHGGARTVGRGNSRQPGGAVTATIEALEQLGAQLPSRLKAIATVTMGSGQVTVVMLGASDDGPDRLGVARAATAAESASRATPQAPNRYLAIDRVLANSR